MNVMDTFTLSDFVARGKEKIISLSYARSSQIPIAKGRNMNLVDRGGS
jgi:hypothetical protein